VAIDIDKLTEPELVDLNNRIVARLRFLQQMRAHASMLGSAWASACRFSQRGALCCLGLSQNTIESQSQSSAKPGNTGR
jgi:hypothetical protein